jgi:hypothetical protein
MVNRWLALVYLLPLLGLSWLLIALLEPTGPAPLEHIIIGYILGTAFGQTTLASAWTALGPAPLLWRLPLSLAWVAALLIAILLNVAIHDPPSVDIALIMSACLAGQWILVQLPLWALAIAYGLRVGHRDDAQSPTIGDRQFGIRQLLILTTIVAMVLAACRWVVTSVAAETDWTEAPVFAFLAIAAVAIALPLIVAGLLPRFSLVASAIVAGLIGLLTWWELPLVNMVGGGPDVWHLLIINVFQVAWIWAILLLLRFCGYGAAKSAGDPPSASTDCLHRR